MATVKGSKPAGTGSNGSGSTSGLSAFGVLMVFPFAVVAFGSLKDVSDVTRYPPRLLPYAQEAAGGRRRGTAAVPDRRRGTGAGRTHPGRHLRRARRPRGAVLAPLSDAERLGGFLDTETVEVDGEEYDLYDVTVDGEERELIQLGTTTEGIFARPDDPTDTAGPTCARRRPSTASPRSPRTSGRCSSCRTSTAASPTRCS
jgi:hypothetical protein